MKKTPFKPKEGKVWKRIQPISKNKEKRARRFVPESIIKLVKERSGGICEFVNQFGGRCPSEAQHQPHHRKKRSQGGKHTLENLADSCWYHNNFAETEKSKSIKLGWTII